MGFRAAALLAAVAAGLSAVGTAEAANSFSFTDPSGDSKLGPDITSVAISNDDSGLLTFKVMLANRSATLFSDDAVFVNLDLDQNPDTGSIFYGTEVALGLNATAPVFLRPDSADLNLVPAKAPPSLRGSFDNGVATLTVAASDLGLSPTGGFNVWVQAGDIFFYDEAPNIGTVNYQLVPGTPPPALGPDTRAPHDVAYPAQGKRGRIVELDYGAADGRGQTADVVRVYARRRVVKTFFLPLRNRDPLAVDPVAWRAPRKTRGPFRFCVVSRDAAGNRSNTACAGISLR